MAATATINHVFGRGDETDGDPFVRTSESVPENDRSWDACDLRGVVVCVSGRYVASD